MDEKTKARFWEKVDRRGPSECWPWKAGRARFGYGKFWVDGETIGAHRFSFEVHNGRVLPGLYVCHRCDNPPCVNPAHLFLDTNEGNQADKYAKGRQAHSEHLGHAKLTNAQVVRIRERVAAGEVQKVLAAEYGVHTTTLNNAVRRRRWRHVR